jgi:hypothetical protein
VGYLEAEKKRIDAAYKELAVSDGEESDDEETSSIPAVQSQYNSSALLKRRSLRSG